MPHQSDFAPLIKAVDSRWTWLAATPLPGGSSARMTLLTVRDEAGHPQKLVLRELSDWTLSHNPQAAVFQYRVLQAAQAIGVRVPTPLYLDPNGRFLVISFMAGTAVYAPADPIHHVTATAKQLARIHQIDPATLTVTLPSATDIISRLLAWQPEQLRTDLLEDRLRERLTTVWPPPSHNASALLHGDFWPGNLLWQDGELVGVVDWEDAQQGDPLADLAISRLDTLLFFGEAAMVRLTAVYRQHTTLAWDLLPIYDAAAALRATHGIENWAAGTAVLGRPDLTPHLFRQRYLQFAEHALNHG